MYKIRKISRKINKHLRVFSVRRNLNKIYLNMNELRTLELKLRLTLDLKTANGLDYISPGTSSSSSSIVTPLNASSNVNIAVEGNENREIVVTATQFTATVSTSSTTTSAVINVSASLSCKCINFVCSHRFLLLCLI